MRLHGSTSARPGYARPMTTAAAVPFGDLEVLYDGRIIEPRPWTVHQSNWAKTLSASLPIGPVLELCCGAGHIGLQSVIGTDRDLVQIDVDPVACSYATRNAERAGMMDRVDVRCGGLAAMVPERRAEIARKNRLVVHVTITTPDVTLARLLELPGEHPERTPVALPGSLAGQRRGPPRQRVMARAMFERITRPLELGYEVRSVAEPEGQAGAGGRSVAEPAAEHVGIDRELGLGQLERRRQAQVPVGTTADPNPFVDHLLGGDDPPIIARWCWYASDTSVFSVQ